MPASSHNHPRPSYTSTGTAQTNTSDVSFTGRRPSNKKENQFIYSRGSKLHTYGRDKAPYPFSFNREILELFCLDHTLIRHVKESMSFVDFKGQLPKRILDLGTGLGDWVIDAAKRWPECTFVGYDIVNVQIPTNCLDPSVSKRIQWVYGNLLRQKLPFDDDEFDYIHVVGMAFAIPELKWPSVFEELHRVLKPGGIIEMIEEDAIFPILPRWFTAPLHAQTRRPAAHFPDGSQSVLHVPASADALPHDHVLLETLYHAVFENRFLNPLPTSVLPGYFTSIFTHVVSPPVISYPMPPFAPLTPLPGELDGSSSDLNDDAEPTTLFLPDLSKDRQSFSVTTDTPPIDTNSILVGREFISPLDFRMLDYPNSSSPSATTHNSGESSSSSKQHRQSVAAFMIKDMNHRIGDETALELLPTSAMASFQEHSLFMHLYRAVGIVMGIREAMWEELLEIVRTDRESLRIHGWEGDDFVDGNARPKFDALFERYRGDMHVRLSLWHSLTLHGWPYPHREPLSKAELVEEERLRREILEARKLATEEELVTPCRSLRLLVGRKGE